MKVFIPNMKLFNLSLSMWLILLQGQSVVIKLFTFSPSTVKLCGLVLLQYTIDRQFPSSSFSCYSSYRYTA